jgi:uncharacterized membrane protein YfcA
MEWLVYLGVGAGAGILAGLLGVGGGVVIVPALVFAFTGLGYPAEHIMHLALGTSLASIMFTSVSSFRAHHKRGAVLWNVVKAITPGIIVGTYAGTYVASMLSTNFLKGFFVVFLYWVSIQMLLNIKPKPKRALPGTPGMFAAGSTIGVVSSLVGIGGGSLSVPFMALCNIPMHTAVGTSAAIGFPVGPGPAAHEHRLHLPPGAHRRGRHERAHRAPGSQARPCPAGGQAQEDFRPAAHHHGHAHARFAPVDGAAMRPGMGLYLSIPGRSGLIWPNLDKSG